MSLFLILLALCCVCMAGWGYNAVKAELTKASYPEPENRTALGFQVEAFIWSSRAPLRLLQRYIATQACAIPAGLCLGALVWINEPRPDIRIMGTIAVCFVSLLMAISLAWKATRESRRA